ncbi:MAG: cbb3-type cytochrome oxidase assembly protein CcoS [Planctomycetota bacterium]
MSTIWIVLPLALLFAAIAVAAFIWAVRTGQLDDFDTPAIRPLVDEADDAVPRCTKPKAGDVPAGQQHRFDKAAQVKD